MNPIKGASLGTTYYTPPKEPTPKWNLFVSLVFLIPRVAIGGAYLASAGIKGALGGATVLGGTVGSKVGLAIFGKASLREARKDLSKGFLLAFGGALAPVGHVWSALDYLNAGRITDAGSRQKEIVYLFAASIQDVIDPYRKPDPHPHIWKKIDQSLDQFANFLTQFRRIEQALKRGRDKNILSKSRPFE